ncbi:hypothetical protein L1049_023145 [Liquidambar formosana]|uniref:RING-type E3 ubiquitin transferase n=1 Tax=Liquidambar formosana TaxID=63359 RepID=A0AAP0WPK2_LIQFO
MSSDSINSTHPGATASVSPPITIILTVFLLLFFFLGFFSIYFCRCFIENITAAWHPRQSPSGSPAGRSGSAGEPGLDPSIIESFPNFTYSAVKDLRQGKYGLECAICLSEFVDDDLLRLLAVCCHVFHQDCIDLWLKSHKTCPVCRRTLDDPVKSPEKLPAINDFAMHESNHERDDQSREHSFTILIKEEDDEEGGGGGGGEGAVLDTANGGNIEGKNTEERFSKSHSTGHSIFTIRGEEDRYTLRLPEDVKAKITKGRHNWTKSCTTFGDKSSNAASGINGGFGELSGFSMPRRDINKV